MTDRRSSSTRRKKYGPRCAAISAQKRTRVVASAESGPRHASSHHTSSRKPLRSRTVSASTIWRSPSPSIQSCTYLLASLRC